jgi:hypothetical protein
MISMRLIFCRQQRREAFRLEVKDRLNGGPEQSKSHNWQAVSSKAAFVSGQRLSHSIGGLRERRPLNSGHWFSWANRRLGAWVGTQK